MRIAVAGTGYVGLVTGVCLAEKGHYITCVDIDKSKIEMMSNGKSPIYEPGLDELMQKNMSRLAFTDDWHSAYSDADVIFIGVGTPEKRDGSANLKYVYAVVDQIAEAVSKECCIVVKSTVPIGTNDKIDDYLKQRAKNGIKLHVVSNPEFLAQGTAVHDTLFPARIVIGAKDGFASDVMRHVYENFDAPVLMTDRKSAEMVKYASNDFLALKISYINEIANFCESVGANIEDVAEGMGYDTRIGNRFLKAGVGYGGSCFPKDTKALSWLANFNDAEIKTIRAAIEVNENQKLKLIKKSKKYYDSLDGLNVAVLGLTFKPGTDDLREAPSIVNVGIMLDDGAKIKAWDNVGSENFKKIYPTEITYCGSVEQTLQDADICFIFTEWQEVMELTAQDYISLMRKPIVLDGRNCYKLSSFENMPIIYDSIGRKTINNL